MNLINTNKLAKTIKNLGTIFLIGSFLASSSIFPSNTYGQTVANLPAPGTAVPASSSFVPAMIRGVTLYPENPLRFDFIIDTGQSNLKEDEFLKEATRLIKYFLASLTLPEDEMWVNLSPYEKNRIIPDSLGNTEMGQDLLVQDYMLKQLTASLMNPEDELGSKFWDRVYAKAQEKFGTTETPMNTFNKIWIVPESANIFEHKDGVYVINSRLKVLLEEDYLALESNVGSTKHGLGDITNDDIEIISGISSEIVSQILIPEIEKEVNEGNTFSNLRQIFNSMILAAWYKQNLKDSLLGQIYVDKNRVKGITTKDKNANQKIYEQYVESFKKGVYNFIKEDYDPYTQETIPRKYFSGGVSPQWEKPVEDGTRTKDELDSAPADVRREYAEDVQFRGQGRNVSINLSAQGPDAISVEAISTTISAGDVEGTSGQASFFEGRIGIDASRQARAMSLAYSFRDFMNEALHNERWGYYASGRVRIGTERGDFATYPQIMSPYFGRMVADQAFKMWQGMRQAGTIAAGEEFTVVEFGAGQAELAYDLLDYMEEKSAEGELWGEFARVFKYRIYELSAGLRAKQKEKLDKFARRVEVLQGDARNPTSTIVEGSIKGLVFTNEVPDAFGVHKVVIDKDGNISAVHTLPYISSNFVTILRDKNVSSGVLERVATEDKNLRSQLGMQGVEQDALFLSRESFTELMDLMSNLGDEEYKKLVKEINVRETLVPARLIPELADYIKQHIGEYAAALEGMTGDVETYINTDATNFIQGAGLILAAGYVVTIDYGYSLFELLEFHKSGVKSGFRAFADAELYNNPYENLTLQDMTTDQDFTNLARAGEKVGLRTVHYGPQGDLSLGTSAEIQHRDDQSRVRLDQLSHLSHLASSAIIDLVETFRTGADGFQMLVQQKEGTDPKYQVFSQAVSRPLSPNQKGEKPEGSRALEERLNQSLADKAMMTDDQMATTANPLNPGGIDLNPNMFTLNIKQDGDGIQYLVPQEPVNNLKIDGFLPTIINITPVTNVAPILGLANEKELGRPTQL